MSQSFKIMLFLLIVGVVWTVPAQAQTDAFWINTSGDHDFANAANWDPAYPVGANNDIAIIQNGGYADISTAADAIYQLRLGADLHTSDPAGSGTVNVLTGGSIESGTVYIGDSGGQTGTLNITGGDFDSNNGSLCVGYGENSIGYFNMSSGSYTTRAKLYMGYEAGSQGFMDISGGTLSFTDGGESLVLGRNDGTYSLVKLSGTGVIQTTGSMDTYIASGDGSVAVFKQSDSTSTYQAAGEGAYTRVGTAKAGTSVSSGYGFYELQGGISNCYGLFVGDSGSSETGPEVGALYQTGGDLTISQSVRIGSSGNGIGTYNLTGGTLAGAVGDSEWIYVGGTGSLGNWGHLNVSESGQISNFDYIRISSADTGNSKGYLTIGTGGLVSVGIIGQSHATVEGGGEAFLTFHGGTLQANRTSANWVKVPTETGGIFIGTEGGIIDTQAFDATITQSIQHLEGYGVGSISVTGQGSGYAGPPVVRISGGNGWGATAVANVETDPGSPNFGKVTGITVTNPGTGYLSSDVLTVELVRGGYSTIATATATMAQNNAVDGGLTKTGSGILTLTDVNTYTGDTIVNEGTLSITTNEALSDTGALRLASSTVMDLNFDISLAETVAGLYLDGVAQALGTWGSSDSNATNKNDTYFTGTGMLLVTASATIPGDTNGDRIVDETDATMVASNWGAPTTEGPSAGDFNSDGVVDATDASIMAANWGNHNQGTDEGMVPEPSMLITLIAGLASLAFFRKRN